MAANDNGTLKFPDMSHAMRAELVLMAIQLRRTRDELRFAYNVLHDDLSRQLAIIEERIDQ